jgi:hypothetical protein
MQTKSKMTSTQDISEKRAQRNFESDTCVVVISAFIVPYGSGKGLFLTANPIETLSLMELKVAVALDEDLMMEQGGLLQIGEVVQ